MFVKPHSVKSNSSIKSSERKRILEVLNTQGAGTDQLKGVLGKSVQQLVGRCHNGNDFKVYSFDNCPCFILMGGIYFPTVYLLWKVPGLLPNLVIHDAVLKALQNGAALMLPGIVNRYDLNLISQIKANQPCAIFSESNYDHAVAVGCALMDGEEMVKCGFKGKGFNVIHTYQDGIWELGPKLLLPSGKPFTRTQPLSNNTDPSLAVISDTVNIEENGAEHKDDILSDDDEDEDNYPDKDDLFINCFLQAAKTSLKKAEFPILYNMLFKKYLCSCLPSDYAGSLNVKETSYKKFGVFVKHLCQQDLVTIDEVSQGVEAITSINHDHSILKSFKTYDVRLDPDMNEEDDNTFTLKNYHAPVFKDFYQPTKFLGPLFAATGLGDVVTASELREKVSQYIKDQKLQDPNNPKNVLPNEILGRACFGNKQPPLGGIAFAAMYDLLFGNATKCYSIQISDRYLVRRGSPKPITLQVVVRVKGKSKSKKATLVAHLEQYFIDKAEFGNHLQKMLSVSSTICVSPKFGNTQVVSFQGDQTRKIETFLVDTLQIPRKYVLIEKS